MNNLSLKKIKCYIYKLYICNDNLDNLSDKDFANFKSKSYSFFDYLYGTTEYFKDPDKLIESHHERWANAFDLQIEVNFPRTNLGLLEIYLYELLSKNLSIIAFDISDYLSHLTISTTLDGINTADIELTELDNKDLLFGKVENYNLKEVKKCNIEINYMIKEAKVKTMKQIYLFETKISFTKLLKELRELLVVRIVEEVKDRDNNVIDRKILFTGILEEFSLDYVANRTGTLRLRCSGIRKLLSMTETVLKQSVANLMLFDNEYELKQLGNQNIVKPFISRFIDINFNISKIIEMLNAIFWHGSIKENQIKSDFSTLLSHINILLNQYLNDAFTTDILYDFDFLQQMFILHMLHFQEDEVLFDFSQKVKIGDAEYSLGDLRSYLLLFSNVDYYCADYANLEQIILEYIAKPLFLEFFEDRTGRFILRTPKYGEIPIPIFAKNYGLVYGNIQDLKDEYFNITFNISVPQARNILYIPMTGDIINEYPTMPGVLTIGSDFQSILKFGKRIGSKVSTGILGSYRKPEDRKRIAQFLIFYEQMQQARILRITRSNEFCRTLDVGVVIGFNTYSSFIPNGSGYVVRTTETLGVEQVYLQDLELRFVAFDDKERYMYLLPEKLYHNLMINNMTEYIKDSAKKDTALKTIISNGYTLFFHWLDKFLKELAIQKIYERPLNVQNNNSSFEIFSSTPSTVKMTSIKVSIYEQSEKYLKILLKNELQLQENDFREMISYALQFQKGGDVSLTNLVLKNIESKKIEIDTNTSNCKKEINFILSHLQNIHLRKIPDIIDKVKINEGIFILNKAISNKLSGINITFNWGEFLSYSTFIKGYNKYLTINEILDNLRKQSEIYENSKNENEKKAIIQGTLPYLVAFYSAVESFFNRQEKLDTLGYELYNIYLQLGDKSIKEQLGTEYENIQQNVINEIAISSMSFNWYRDVTLVK